MMIDTSRLRLIRCELQHYEAFLASPERLGELLGVRVPQGVIDFPEAMRFAYEHLREHPEEAAWWTFLFLHRTDSVLAGIGGYKGPPDERGRVELGYGIAPEYRGQGLATEAACGLLEHALGVPEVHMVDAHTLAEENASVRVLRKASFTKIGEVHDPDDGDLWHWRREKPAPVPG